MVQCGNFVRPVTSGLWDPTALFVFIDQAGSVFLLLLDVIPAVVILLSAAAACHHQVVNKSDRFA